MLTPSLNTVMTRLLIVVAVLGTLVFIAPAIFAQESSTIQYTENGTDQVRIFVSEDPEGAGIDWDVTGLDSDFFTIDSRGMLMFKKAPNYESAKDREQKLNTSDPDNNNVFEPDVDYLDYYDPVLDVVVDRQLGTDQPPTITVFHVSGPDGDGTFTRTALTGEDVKTTIPSYVMPRHREFAGKDNDYQITIRATEGEGTTNRALSTESHYTVQVMNANEGGTVTMNWLQPEVGTPITASLSDPDGLTSNENVGIGDDAVTGKVQLADVKWEWFISKVTSPDKDDSGHWTPIPEGGAEFTDDPPFSRPDPVVAG